MTMKLKLDDEGHAVLEDGKPVYIHDDGKEMPFDAPAAVAKIGSLNAEAKTHREAKEKAEAALKTFEGIENPEDAIKALATVKNLDDKKLVDAGKVEEVKAAAIKAAEEKYAPIVQERDGLQASLNKEMIGGRFSRSAFIKDKLAIIPDFAEAYFSKNFKIEDGKVVAYHDDGNKVFSRSKPGEVADFDEALEILVESHSQKNHLLKGSGGSGSGAQPGDGGGNGQKTITRAEFDRLSPADQMQKIKDGVTPVDS